MSIKSKVETAYDLRQRAAAYRAELEATIEGLSERQAILDTAPPPWTFDARTGVVTELQDGERRVLDGVYFHYAGVHFHPMAIAWWFLTSVYADPETLCLGTPGNYSSVGLK